MENISISIKGDGNNVSIEETSYNIDEASDESSDAGLTRFSIVYEDDKEAQNKQGFVGTWKTLMGINIRDFIEQLPEGYLELVSKQEEECEEEPELRKLTFIIRSKDDNVQFALSMALAYVIENTGKDMEQFKENDRREIRFEHSEVTNVPYLDAMKNREDDAKIVRAYRDKMLEKFNKEYDNSYFPNWSF